MATSSAEQEPQSPLQEIVKPFVDLVRAPRALWGVNLGYFLEGLVYFGMLGYLAIHFSDFIFAGLENADVYSHQSVMVLTAGITLAMLLLGFVPDRFGVRRALIWAFVLLIVGRVLISGAASVGLEPGLWSPLHLTTMLGILVIVVGYGMYQPAAYAAVRQFTDPKTSAMGFAMLYALMNLGGYLPTYAFLLRDDDFLGIGITGVFWVYTLLTVVALVATIWLLTPRVVRAAIADAKAKTAALKAAEGKPPEGSTPESTDASADAAKLEASLEGKSVPWHLWVFMALLAVFVWFVTEGPLRTVILVSIAAVALPALTVPRFKRWLAVHPLADAKFFYFIFALIPVQTLFVYNWMILPQYINRAYEGWIGEYFEIASNFNPLLIFVAVPIVTALTQKRKVYNMMILGTFIMAAPAFLLVLGPNAWTLFSYIVIMTIGEAMWQPRFLQYAAEIAPEGRTGIYMGVAQFPWFLTKVIVPLYSGYMIAEYVPADGPQRSETMWLWFALIAMSSTVMLILAKGWLGRDFKERV